MADKNVPDYAIMPTLVSMDEETPIIRLSPQLIERLNKRAEQYERVEFIVIETVKGAEEFNCLWNDALIRPADLYDWIRRYAKMEKVNSKDAIDWPMEEARLAYILSYLAKPIKTIKEKRALRTTLYKRFLERKSPDYEVYGTYKMFVNELKRQLKRPGRYFFGVRIDLNDPIVFIFRSYVFPLDENGVIAGRSKGVIWSDAAIRHDDHSIILGQITGL